jgi:uncharacterized protein (TIGR03000 family)
MFRQAVTWVRYLALVGFCVLLGAGQANAQQGWPIAGANWDLYGGSGRGGSSSSPSPSYSPSYYNHSNYTPAYRAPAYSAAYPPSVSYSTTYSNQPASLESSYVVSTAESDGKRPARVNFRVPNEAKVWFESIPTTSSGTVRSFESPPLDVGHDYAYRIRVEWNKDGKNVTDTRQITVHAGDVINLAIGNPSQAATVR